MRGTVLLGVLICLGWGCNKESDKSLEERLENVSAAMNSAGSPAPAAAASTHKERIPKSMRGAWGNPEYIERDDLDDNYKFVNITSQAIAGHLWCCGMKTISGVKGTFSDDVFEFAAEHDGQACTGSLEMMSEDVMVTVKCSQSYGSAETHSIKATKHTASADSGPAKAAVAPKAAVAMPDRAAPAAAAPVAVAAAPARASSGPQVGDIVKAKWKGDWYKAKILKVRGNRYYITYPGWSSSWNEWVPASKIRGGGGGSAPAAAAPAKSGGGMTRATVTVKVQKTKSNGKAWDAFGGEPDIAICVSSDSGTKCYPDGDSEMGILEPKCRDTFRCTFRGVKVPTGEFEISVMDVDMAANDSVGSAYCSKGKSCSAGQAKVTIR